MVSRIRPRISFFISFPFPLSPCLNYSSLLLFSFLFVSPFFYSQPFSLLYLSSFIISFSIFFNHRISPFLQFFPYVSSFANSFLPSFIPTCPSVYSQALQTSTIVSWHTTITFHLDLKFVASSANWQYTAIHNVCDAAVLCLGVLSLRLKSLP